MTDIRKTKLHIYNTTFFGINKCESTEHSKNTTRTTTNGPFSFTSSPYESHYKDNNNNNNNTNKTSFYAVSPSPSCSVLLKRKKSTSNIIQLKKRSCQLQTFHKQCLHENYLMNKTYHNLSPLTSLHNSQNIFLSESTCLNTHHPLPKSILSDDITFIHHNDPLQRRISKDEYTRSSQNIRRNKFCLDMKKVLYVNSKETEDNLISEQDNKYYNLKKQHNVLTKHIVTVTKEYMKHIVSIKEKEELILSQLRLDKEKIRHQINNLTHKYEQLKNQLYKCIQFRNLLIMVKEKVLSLPNELSPEYVIKNNYEQNYSLKLNNNNNYINGSNNGNNVLMNFQNKLHIELQRRSSINPNKKLVRRRSFEFRAKSINSNNNNNNRYDQYTKTRSPIFMHVDNFISHFTHQEDFILQRITQLNQLKNEIRVIKSYYHNIKNKDTCEIQKKNDEIHYLTLILSEVKTKYKDNSIRLTDLKEDAKQIVKNFYFHRLYSYLRTTALHLLSDNYIQHLPHKDKERFKQLVNVDVNKTEKGKLRQIIIDILALLELNMNRLFVKINIFKHEPKNALSYNRILAMVIYNRRVIQNKQQKERLLRKKKEMILKVIERKDRIFIRKIRKDIDGLNKQNDNERKEALDEKTRSNSSMRNVGSVETLIKYFNTYI